MPLDWEARRNLASGQWPSAVHAIVALKPGLDLIVRERRFRMHAHEQMKVVAHQAKA